MLDTRYWWFSSKWSKSPPFIEFIFQQTEIEKKIAYSQQMMEKSQTGDTQMDI